MTNFDSSSTEQHFVKTMRHFSTRVVQAVVQSRMGDDFKVCQPCSARNDNSVWFNLVIDEIGEIAAHLKQKMEKYSPLSHSLCLEFTLHTADGDYLPLEFWVIWVDPTYTDENADVRTVVYSQLNTLLKSVIMATRFTPTYRYYVSKQRLDTYVILYKVSINEPDFSILGEERKFCRLGTLPTPFGSIRMDLHYRTNMVILPAPLTVETTPEPQTAEDDILERDNSPINHVNSDVYGNVVPTKGSKVIVASSPALEDINCFSTSPLSQDLPFVDIDEEDEDEDETSFKLGRSSSTETSEGKVGRYLSGGSVKSDTNSPKASYSFPQRTRQLRTRNNSFPFASLLDAHSSSDQTKSQILPKVPEDCVINGALHTSSSHRILSSKTRSFHKRRSFTCQSAPVSYEQLKATDEKQICTLNKQSEGLDATCDDKDFCTKKKVVFGCSVEEEDDDDNNVMKEVPSNAATESEEGIKILRGAEPKEDTENKAAGTVEDDRQSCSSDDSYVKVIAFASSDNLYTDLTDFAQDMHLAPKTLTSCLAESANDLTKQIDEFSERAYIFDNFVAGLREMDEGEH